MSNVEHPNHYKTESGIEVIDFIRHMTWNRGNAVKYICRAGKKNPDKEIEDLKKAIFCIQDEIKFLESRVRTQETCVKTSQSEYAEMVRSYNILPVNLTEKDNG